MIRLDAATVLLQWSAGGMLFCWFTTRRRLVGLGYGWLLRGVYAGLAVAAFVIGQRFAPVPAREATSLAVAATTLFALGVSIARRSAGVSGESAEHDRRSERVAAMTGIERTGRSESPAEATRDREALKEFPPFLDLVPALVAVIGLTIAAADAVEGGDEWDVTVAVARTLVGAAFLGAITDAMLLGHWYLVQPGLPRRLLNEIVTAVAWLWPFEVLVMLLPTGMIAVLNGTVDDGWGGMLGWMWVACAITTIVLVMVTRAALKERAYSAVMAATGLLYLAILTAFGMDIVARAVLADA